MSDEIPSTIGRYVVQRLLGRGAMGSVYLGRDPDLDRPVAIKTVRDLGLDENKQALFLERFKNEARAAAKLSDPAIVAVYDVGEDDGIGPYLVFEYVPGPTLKEMIQSRGPMDVEELIPIARKLARGIDTAHAVGVIHRDIKPDNILVTQEGDPKLADFGVARLPDAALTKEGQFLGTPCYAAPETLDGGRYGPHSDLFSFGAVLYEAVTGRRAFPGTDAIAVAHMVVHDEPQKPSDRAPGLGLPREVDLVLMRALNKKEKARYRSAGALVEALAHAFGVPDANVTAEGIGGGGSWAFAAVALGGLLVGLALVAAYGDFESLSTITLSATDAGPPDAGDAGVDAGDAGVDAGPPDAGEEEHSHGEGQDAGPGDAGAADAGDAGPPDAGLASMSPFDREEAAKDAISRARRALARGDRVTARRELGLARLYDPENDDIADLESRLGGEGGSTSPSGGEESGEGDPAGGAATGGEVEPG